MTSNAQVVIETQKENEASKVSDDLFRSIVLNEKGLIDNFCGFKLLQYEDSIYSQFGEPTFEESLEDDVKYVVFVNPDENLVFELAKLPESSWAKQIVSIQLSGKSSSYSVRGIELGSSQSLISKIFGLPSSTLNIENDYGVAELIQFDDYNISFELNNDKVTSINVFYGNITKENTEENNQLTNFEVFKNILSNFTTEELINLFAPDFEISATGEDYILFEKGFQTDITSNTDLINFISDDANGLKSLLNPKIQVESVIRFRSFDDKISRLSVLKVENSKSINEIVFKEYFGRLLIWEIN